MSMSSQVPTIQPLGSLDSVVESLNNVSTSHENDTSLGQGD